jgi:lipopolysaccharide transport system ATP-binding protein
MSEVAIRVQDLGKRYLIRHQSRPRYRTLRESVTEGAKRLFGPKMASTAKTEEFWALREASLEIRRGDVVGVIGRNGAGKSTFLKLLSRITEPTTGRIEFSGRIASLLEVGTGFHPELSGRENIFLNGAILGMRQGEIRRKFDEIVDFADIEKFLDTPVKFYSSGMYMRLAFAVAAHMEPDILLVDEVLAVGDAEFQKKCLGRMQQVARENARTVIFVSHNMQAVKALCTRTAHFDHGRILDFGPTEEIVRGYLAANTSTSGTWTATETVQTGGTECQLLSVQASDSKGSAGSYLSSEDLTVTMVFRLVGALPALCVGFDLLASDGTTVLRSYQTDQREHEWPPQSAGTHAWSCVIPAGLLNGGTYYVSPRIGVHNLRWIVTLDAVLQFEIILNHGVSPFWNSLAGKARPGVVAPILRWISSDPGKTNDFVQSVNVAGR